MKCLAINQAAKGSFAGLGFGRQQAERVFRRLGLGVVALTLGTLRERGQAQVQEYFAERLGESHGKKS